MDGLVETPLYGGIVAREVGKGVLSVGVSDKGPAKAPLNSTAIKPLLIYCRFHGQNPVKPPGSRYDAGYQEWL
jgi:hypothetical protein